MNLENMDILAQKVEKVLETMRQLKAENSRLRSEVHQTGEKALEELKAKDSELIGLRTQMEEKDREIERLNDSIRSQGEEIQLAQERFQQLLSTIETELGTEIPLTQESAESVEKEETSEADSKPQEVAQNDFFG